MTDARLRPPVFDSIDRTNARPADHLETSFQFLNRIAGNYWAQVRQLVQEWLDRVANDEDYRDLRGRLRSDNAANYSAFLELYVHELFRRAGYGVTIHPSLRGSSRHPDFLMEGHGQSFYVEATMPGPQGAAQGRSQRRAAFLDTLQRCTNRDFFLSLDHLIVGPTPVRGRLVRRNIEQWLGGLDPDKVSYDLDERETFRWEADGWEAEFSAIPVPPEHRGRLDHRPIGVYADGGVHFIDDAPAIRSALASKSIAYGELDRPLIVALGTYIWDRDRWHSMNALYGHAAVTWSEGPDGTIEHAGTRRPDGFFGTPNRWRNQAVSAVLHVNQLQPHHLQQAEVTLWPHPAARDQLHALVGRIPATAVRPSGGGALQEISPSIDAAGHFGLPDPWPVGEAFPHV